jgi:hypothetical protein
MHFYDKTTKNQQRSTDKIAPISDVFKGIISRFQMAYTPYEHTTSDEQLVVFRGKCPFRVFMKSKPGKYGSNCELLMMQILLCLQHASIYWQE